MKELFVYELPESGKIQVEPFVAKVTKKTYQSAKGAIPFLRTLVINKSQVGIVQGKGYPYRLVLHEYDMDKAHKLFETYIANV